MKVSFFIAAAHIILAGVASEIKTGKKYATPNHDSYGHDKYALSRTSYKTHQYYIRRHLLTNNPTAETSSKRSYDTIKRKRKRERIISTKNSKNSKEDSDTYADNRTGDEPKNLSEHRRVCSSRISHQSDLIVTTTHLELIHYTKMKITLDDVVSLEEIVLQFLYDSIGSKTTFQPICVHITETSSSREAITLGSGRETYMEAFAFKMDIDYEIHVSNMPKCCCTGEKKVSCCTAATNGRCSCCCRECSKRSMELSPDRDHDARSNTGLSVAIKNGSNFDPRRTLLIMDGTNTTSVASCGLHRFMQDIFDIPFSCNDYESLNCKENEGDTLTEWDIICQ